jgi:hypothetical protein
MPVPEMFDAPVAPLVLVLPELEEPVIALDNALALLPMLEMLLMSGLAKSLFGTPRSAVIRQAAGKAHTYDACFACRSSKFSGGQPHRQNA